MGAGKLSGVGIDFSVAHFPIAVISGMRMRRREWRKFKLCAVKAIESVETRLKR